MIRIKNEWISMLFPKISNLAKFCGFFFYLQIKFILVDKGKWYELHNWFSGKYSHRKP